MTIEPTGGPPRKEVGGLDVAIKAAAPATGNSTRIHRAEDGFATPSAEDRAVAQAIAVLREHGYGIACRCLDCNRPITAAASLARMRGRRCAERAGVTA